MPLTPLLSRHQLAKFFNISVSGLDKLIRRDPTFPRPLRLGRLVRWNLAAIDSYLTANSVEAAPTEIQTPQDCEKPSGLG